MIGEAPLQAMAVAGPAPCRLFRKIFLTIIGELNSTEIPLPPPPLRLLKPFSIVNPLSTELLPSCERIGGREQRVIPQLPGQWGDAAITLLRRRCPKMCELTSGIGLNFVNLKTPAEIGAVAPQSRDIEARGVSVEGILESVRILPDC